MSAGILLDLVRQPSTGPRARPNEFYLTRNGVPLQSSSGDIEPGGEVQFHDNIGLAGAVASIAESLLSERRSSSGSVSSIMLSASAENALDALLGGTKAGELGIVMGETAGPKSMFAGHVAPLPAARRVEPAPTEGSGDVWAEVIKSAGDDPTISDAVIEAMRARRQFGVDKYGTPLQRDNGRDHLVDLLQELLDALVYARAAGDMEQTEGILLGMVEGLVEMTSEPKADPCPHCGSEMEPQ